MGPWLTRVFWKVATAVAVERIDVANDPKVTAGTRDDRARAQHAGREHVVENHEAGLLFVEAVWWSGSRRAARVLDGRRKIESSASTCVRSVEITAQEMLTKDRIALRVTLTAFRRIADPERVVRRCRTWTRGCTVWCSSRSAGGGVAHVDEVCRPRTRSTRSFAPMCASASRRPHRVTELGVKDVILPARSASS